MKNGFWTPIGSGIPDSLSWISDSKTQDSEYHNKKNFQDSASDKQQFVFFRKPDSLEAKVLNDLESRLRLKRHSQVDNLSSYELLKDLETPGS